MIPFALLLGLVVLVVLFFSSRTKTFLRVPAAVTGLLLAALALFSMLHPPEKAVTRLYRSIDAAAGYVMANRLKADLPNGSGTVVLLQFTGAGDRIDRLVREQRRGVEQALSGSGFTIVSTGPKSHLNPNELDRRERSSPMVEEDLIATLAPIDNPVALISFIGVPVSLSDRTAWPGIYTMQLAADLDYRNLMERGIVRAVVRSNGNISPFVVPDEDLSMEELFALRYELVTDSDRL